MADMIDNFDCTFRWRDEIDVSNAALCRQAILDVVNDPAFENALNDLRTTAATARGGPTPRGGEVNFDCRADSHGNVECRVGGSVRW